MQQKMKTKQIKTQTPVLDAVAKSQIVGKSIANALCSAYSVYPGYVNAVIAKIL